MKFLKQLVKKELNTDTNEEIRRIRTLLLQKSEVKVVQFVNSNESKSIYQKAYELAKSFSLIEKKTVLVNFNLRSEELFLKHSDEHTFVGLDEYLTLDVVLNNLVVPINDHFHLITNKISLSNSTDFLNEERISILFENLRNKYDYVFIVAPSLQLCYDALILGKFSDGLLYIKEDRSPSKSVLTKHASLLAQIGKPMLGLVITNIDL